jgi:hypothetical protein
MKFRFPFKGWTNENLICISLPHGLASCVTPLTCIVLLFVALLRKVGLTFTEITAPGKLGSEEKLRKGMERGDVVMKMKKGKDFYYMAQDIVGTVTEDAKGCNPEN